jgi:hypothetical protein
VALIKKLKRKKFAIPDLTRGQRDYSIGAFCNFSFLVDFVPGPRNAVFVG